MRTPRDVVTLKGRQRNGRNLSQQLRHDGVNRTYLEDIASAQLRQQGYPDPPVFFKLGLYLDEAAIALDLAEQWPPKRSFGLIGPEGEFGGLVQYSAIPAAVNVRFAVYSVEKLQIL